MLLSNRIDDGEVATLLVTHLPRVVPRGGPRVQLMRADAYRVMIIISYRSAAHGHIARAHHTVHHHVLSVELLETPPVRLSGDRRAIDRCQARAGGFRIIDARGRVLRALVQIRDGRLFREAVSTRSRCRYCRDKRLLVNAKQRDATDDEYREVHHHSSSEFKAFRRLALQSTPPRSANNRQVWRFSLKK